MMTTGNFVSNVADTLGQMGRKLLSEGARRLESWMPKSQDKNGVQAQPVKSTASAKADLSDSSTPTRSQTRTTGKRASNKGRRNATKSKGRAGNLRAGSKNSVQTAH